MICISGCDDNQVSVGIANLTGQEMFNIMKTVLDDFERKQQVQLSSSQKFDLTRELHPQRQ